jgi:hypothetical protein
MADKVQNPDTKEDLSTKVKNWVEEQGYSLEMRVAKRFQENGFSVSQFEHFVDQESHSVRPVDVVATLSQDFESSRVDVKLYIECKYSAKDKPWVIVVTSDKFDKHAFFSRTLKGQHPYNWKRIDSLQGSVTAKLIQNIEKEVGLGSFMIKNPGYVVAEAFKVQSDHAYDAIMQISKCVEAHDNDVEETYKKTIQGWEQIDYQMWRNFGLFFSIAIPIVVINGQLFESYLTNDNVVEASEIESGTVFVPYRRHETNPHAEVVLSPVTVVTEKHLDSFIVLMKKTIEAMLSQNEAIKEIIGDEQDKIVNPRDSFEF